MANLSEIHTKDEFIYVTTALLGRDASNQDRETADQLLADLYKKQQAWQICKEVLTDCLQVDSLVFTASKMLRVKMFYYFNELPPEHYLDMFSFLIGRCL